MLCHVVTAEMMGCDVVTEGMMGCHVVMADRPG